MEQEANNFNMTKVYNSIPMLIFCLCCLFCACGDEYIEVDENELGNEKDKWRNVSIRQYLEKQGNFQTYLRLLADNDLNSGNDSTLINVLDNVAPKTVFVSNDETWDKFFKANSALPETDLWHNATSYENLSAAQKKLLLHVSLLNDSILTANLPNGQSADENITLRGEYMRRSTNLKTTDTITYMSSEMLPYSYNTNDKDFWWRFRTKNGGKGLYIVKDSSQSMMLFFTSEFMSKNSVNDDDYAKLFGCGHKPDDVQIYDAFLLKKDVACKNGYVNFTSKPLVPLANMAEVIRSNGKTNIFSHMLDRFCAPYYSETITLACRMLYPDKFGDSDSVFTMRYFSDNSFGHKPNLTQPDGNPYTGDEGGSVSLKFDPGWNGYYDEVDAEKDMAAMFVPSDEALWKYFTEGGGMTLIETYDPNYVPGQTYANEDELYQAIDLIPLSTLQGLINVIMFRSFTGSVPSKMTRLLDDGREQIFYPEDIEKIDTCLLACNGAVYIMSDIYGPTDYTSVASPAYISKTNLVMKWAIYNGSSGTDYMGLNYYAYLKAMQSEFTFFLPSDAALQYDYDPTSYESNTPRLIQFNYKNQAFPIQTKCYDYNPETGEIGRPLTGSGASLQQDEITNRLKDILESHTIVHDGTNPIDGEDVYFLTKNGNAVKVERAIGEDGKNHIVAIKGGLQLENERNGMSGDTPGETSCQVTKPFESLKNGQTFIVDAPVIPTYRSVYNILTQDEGWKKTSEEEWNATNPYAEFFKLCKTNTTIVRKCGLVDEKKLSTEGQKASMKKFQIFTDKNGLDFNVQFFSNFHYTAFIPSNEAIEDAIANGLPTWDEIEADYNEMQPVVNSLDSLKDIMDNDGYVFQEEDSIQRNQLWERAHADSIKLQAKITYLTNFIRYHFVDKSIFADKSSRVETEFSTYSYDKRFGVFCKLFVDRPGNDVLRVRDAYSYTMMETVGEKNVLARDIECSLKPVGRPMATSGKKITMDASSACVIHLIPGVLNHTKLKYGRHDSEWASVAAAKKYLGRYAIVY